MAVSLQNGGNVSLDNIPLTTNPQEAAARSQKFGQVPNAFKRHAMATGYEIVIA